MKSKRILVVEDADFAALLGLIHQMNPRPDPQSLEACVAEMRKSFDYRMQRAYAIGLKDGASDAALDYDEDE